MKIKQVIEDYEDGTGSTLEILVNGKRELCFSDGEPEDNNMCRNFNDCYKLMDVLKKVYEAGKNGEPLEITSD